MTCILLKALEKSCIHGAIGFGFASHWFKNWREISKPIITCSNCNRVITFDWHLKTAQYFFDVQTVARLSVNNSTSVCTISSYMSNILELSQVVIF